MSLNDYCTPDESEDEYNDVAKIESVADISNPDASE